MLKSLSSRPILTATTSVAALCLGVALVLPLTQHPLPVPAPTQQPAVLKKPQSPVAALPKASIAPQPMMEKSAVPDALLPPFLKDKTVALKAELPQAPPAQNIQPKASRSADATQAITDDKVAPRPEIDALQGTPMVNPGIASRKLAAPGQAGAVMPAPMDQMAPAPLPNTEAYANAPQNPVHVTSEEPVSTFSADVDTASYSVIRSSLNAGQLPSADAVRIEEMVNYFPYDLPQPEADAPFQPSVSVMQTPWNPNTKLVTIALQGRKVTERPPLNLIFLIDTSGSMDEANKLPLLKQSLALMLPKLAPQDRVAIVTYAGSAGEVLPPTPASDRTMILNALDNLDAGGSTAGAEGLRLAYQVAGQMAETGRISRILLATDGDFNVGIDNPDDLKTFIATQRTTGIYLSVLGFGRGNLDDATMQALAQNGNGTASHIDTLSEAQKVLGDQLTGALFPIADDVKIQVEWNPAQVAEYRLIGYETRALRREDFNNDKVDAGEIGAGLQVTALYEVTSPGSPAILNDALRYSKTPEPTGPNELGFLRLRYKNPGEAASHLIETPISPDAPATQEAHFAAAIAGFGQLLEHSTYLGDWGYDQAITLANAAKGSDPYGYRAEAVTLMRLAQSLSR
ncbi:MAG: YfbK domain-containing protein [Cypionkella sp.]